MIPRATHPGAWWLWALLLAATVLRTTNPVLLCLIGAVAWFVVISRRTDAPWSSSFRTFLMLGLAVLVIRLVFQVLFGARMPGQELFTTPSISLPDWLAGVSIGGAVTAESLMAGFYDGLQIAVLLACMGAANALTSPYRLLRCMPAVLYEAGVAVTVALTFAPNAGAAARQVREARRLRGRPHRGIAGMRGLAIPVLESALERSLTLAASMDSRGYGRAALVSPSRRRVTSVSLAAGLLAVFVGLYGLLSVGTPSSLGLPALAVGAALLAGAMFTSGKHSLRTRYRPDVWKMPEWLTVASAAVALGIVMLTGRADAAALHPSTNPIVLPSVPVLVVLGILVALAPAFVTPEHP